MVRFTKANGIIFVPVISDRMLRQALGRAELPAIDGDDADVGVVVGPVIS
jgi:hypothetical protein